MVEIRLVNTEDRRQVNSFVQFQFDLYKDCPYWCPPFRSDVELMLNKKKHTFYSHSEADFFTAWQDGKMVGRIAVLNNRPYNQYHNEKGADFCLFDAIDSQEVANALFDAAANWARERGLDKIIGSKGFSLYDGYGVLVEEGFDEPQLMSMSAYNYPYYQALFENYGFYKINEFVSMKFNVKDFVMPEKVHKVAEIVEKRGTLKVMSFKTTKELIDKGIEIAHMYFDSFKNNWEYYPMSDAEFQAFIDNTLKFVDPGLIRVIADEQDNIVGMLVNFPDLSNAMKRHNGKMTPALVLDLLLEMKGKRSNKAALNGFGILEQYHKRGGNALLYCAMEEVFKENPNFEICEAVQMAETAKEVQREMATLGLKISKRHRVYEVKIAE